MNENYYKALRTGYDTGSETLPYEPDYSDVISEEAQLDGLSLEDAIEEGQKAVRNAASDTHSAR